MKNYFQSFSQIYFNTREINWQEVYDLFLPRVYHFFCYKVSNLDLAEELTAITFEKAWISRKNFHQEKGQVSTWLMGIARNVAVDHYRRNQNEIPMDSIEIPDTKMDLAENIQTKLDFQHILSILSTYPDRERELIALKYGSEMTNREIARLTGLSESNVGTIIYRIVKKLRKEWEEYYEG